MWKPVGWEGMHASLQDKIIRIASAPGGEVSVEDLVAVPQQPLQHSLQAGLATLRPVEQQAHHLCIGAIREVHDLMEHRVHSG